MKRIIALLLAIVCIAGCMTACGKSQEDIAKDIAKDVIGDVLDDVMGESNKGSSSGKGDPTNPREPDPEPESSEDPNAPPTELTALLDNIIKSYCDEDGKILDYVVDYDSELEEATAYEPLYDAKMLYKASRKNADLKIFTESDSVKATEWVKVNKNNWVVYLENEVKDTSTVSIVKVDGEWKMDISALVTVASLEAPGKIAITVNGTEISFDAVTSKTGYSYIYTIPGILAGAVNTVSYDTGIADIKYEGEFVAGTTVDIRYNINSDEASFANLCDAAEVLWNGLFTGIRKQDTVALQNLIDDDSNYDTSFLLSTAYAKDKYDEMTLLAFSKTTGADSVLLAKDVYKLHVLGEYHQLLNYTYSSDAHYYPKEASWVIVKAQSDGTLKVIEASETTWLKWPYYMAQDN